MAKDYEDGLRVMLRTCQEQESRARKDMMFSMTDFLGGKAGGEICDQTRIVGGDVYKATPDTKFIESRSRLFELSSRPRLGF